VKKGQLLAELISEDARLALSAAERAHDRSAAEHNLQQVQVTVAEAEASAMADQVKAAEAKLAEERDNQARIASIPKGSVSEQERTRSRLLVEGQLAEVAARKSQRAAALAKVDAARAQAEVLETAVAAAAVEVEKNKLALSRTRIHSPVDGVILHLHAAPGQKKLLAMDEHLSATVATLFEKGKLQARVDVPLADARGLATGQEAVITSDFLPNREFRGVVSRIVGAADLQRNTLQAKVRVLDPDPRLRPEMLCRVKFLDSGTVPSEAAAPSAASGQATTGSDGARAIMVPEAAVIPGADAGAALWIVGSDGVTAGRRSVTLGALKREGHVAVSSGVLSGELIILPPHDQLAEGRRVSPSLVSRQP
jgi:RND family efflux transporter MFP subunit